MLFQQELFAKAQFSLEILFNTMESCCTERLYILAFFWKQNEWTMYGSSIAEWLEPGPSNSRVRGSNPAQVLFISVTRADGNVEAITESTWEEEPNWQSPKHKSGYKPWIRAHPTARAGLRQVRRHIAAHMVLTQEAILEEGRQKKWMMSGSDQFQWLPMKVWFELKWMNFIGRNAK